jgi:23S rRNA (uridine2552-2'-O)-methyltransferase
LAKSKRRWLIERKKDVFFKQAKELGYESRAIFKLKYIDSMFNILKEGNIVIELGCSPGGWSLYILEKIGESGKLYAIDKAPLPIKRKYPQIEFIQTDVLQSDFLDILSKKMVSDSVDVILSDLAPNMTGKYELDYYRQITLVKISIATIEKFLKRGGSAVVKVFEGPESQNLRKLFLSKFKFVHSVKPPASRKHSSEFYLVGLRYFGGAYST